MVLIERCDDDLADLTIGHGVARAGANDLDQHVFVDDQSFARGRLEGDHADIGRRVQLVRADAA